jgi:hypothetical protein
MTAEFTQQKKIEGIVANLMEQICLLSPHPDCPDYEGPLFFNEEAPTQAAAGRGAFGSIIFKNGLGQEFASAASENLDQFIAHLESGMVKLAANTNFKPGDHNVISPLFRLHAMHEDMMAAYLRDLPRRMGLERSLIHYKRKLHALRKNASCARVLAA